MQSPRTYRRDEEVTANSYMAKDIWRHVTSWNSKFGQQRSRVLRAGFYLYGYWHDEPRLTKTLLSRFNLDVEVDFATVLDADWKWRQVCHPKPERDVTHVSAANERFNMQTL